MQAVIERSLTVTKSPAFREAFIRRMQETGTTVADVARGSGVSKEKLYKLAQRKITSTEVEDAMKVAAYFGMSLEEFTASTREDRIARIAALYNRLSAAEQAFVETQLEALSARRKRPD